MTKAFELAELANVANVDIIANTLSFNTAISLPSINAVSLTGTVPLLHCHRQIVQATVLF